MLTTKQISKNQHWSLQIRELKYNQGQPSDPMAIKELWELNDINR